MNRNIRFEQKGDKVLHSKSRNNKAVIASICVVVLLLCIAAFEDGLVTKFYPESYAYAGTASTDISFANATSSNAKAGTYHGTVCFRIECVTDTN